MSNLFLGVVSFPIPGGVKDNRKLLVAKEHTSTQIMNLLHINNFLAALIAKCQIGYLLDFEVNEFKSK